MLPPLLNQVKYFPSCRSRWASDASRWRQLVHIAISTRCAMAWMIQTLGLSLLPLPRRQPVPCALPLQTTCRLGALSKRARRGVVCLQGASRGWAAKDLVIASRWPRGRAWGCGAQKVLSCGQWWWPLGAGRSFWVAGLVVLTAPTTVCSLSIVGGDQEQQQRQRHHQPLVKYFKVLSLVLYFSTEKI